MGITNEIDQQSRDGFIIDRFSLRLMIFRRIPSQDTPEFSWNHTAFEAPIPGIISHLHSQFRRSPRKSGVLSGTPAVQGPDPA